MLSGARETQTRTPYPWELKQQRNKHNRNRLTEAESVSVADRGEGIWGGEARQQRDSEAPIGRSEIVTGM